MKEPPRWRLENRKTYSIIGSRGSVIAEKPKGLISGREVGLEYFVCSEDSIRSNWAGSCGIASDSGGRIGSSLTSRLVHG